ncbi:hypothetical protein IBE10_09175 [Francisella tularensis subsp. novicida]|uniref:hypothetical protein n=1 Tax=Francisella tularensis TaxID=263 RepID=UPI0008FD1998|nr:hypothetical protein [Francisella tularensis]APC96168.1 hypothetical protein KX02_1861 [Francisella tularensis subsp. novicida]MBK2347085.1 hypothetical protein [Francisella tularensis subsp. novicida]
MKIRNKILTGLLVGITLGSGAFANVASEVEKTLNTKEQIKVINGSLGQMKVKNSSQKKFYASFICSDGRESPEVEVPIHTSKNFGLDNFKAGDRCGLIINQKSVARPFVEFIDPSKGHAIVTFEVNTVDGKNSKVDCSEASNAICLGK